MREREVWLNAAAEARIAPEKVSMFGQSVGKIPQSSVEQILKLNPEKTRDFNFQGSLFSKDVVEHRKWVPRFVDRYFKDIDFLRYTDAPGAYTPKGKFDHTKEPGSFRPKEYAFRDRRMWTSMNAPYFQILASSKFTLCPRGDRAFSYRFYEAALAGSIPVVSSLDKDMAKKFSLGYDKIEVFQALRCIGYHFYEVGGLADGKANSTDGSTLKSGPPLQYKPAWVEENRKLFLKYQTFITGDNVPPNCSISA